MNSDNDMDFIFQVRERAHSKAEEIKQLVHEQRRTEMLIERAKRYLDQLNAFLEAEGQRPELLKESPRVSPIGKPGNRAKDFPIRKAEWEGMSLFEAVKAILETSPNEIQHADEIANKVYEIQTPKDLRRVKQSLVSTLRNGAKKGLWEGLKRNKYKAKVFAQGRLVRV